MNALIDNLYRNHTEKKRVIKRPGYELYYKQIGEVYKNIKFIYMIRNPYSVVASRKFYLQKPQWNEANKGIFYDVCMNIILSYNTYETIKEEGKFPLLKVKYEDLVKSPKKEIKKMCKFLDVNYYEDLVHYNNEWAETLNSSLSSSVDYNVIIKTP